MIVTEQSLMSFTQSPETITTTITTTEEPLPGKTWVVLADEEGGYNVTLPLGFGKIRNSIKEISHIYTWILLPYIPFFFIHRTPIYLIFDGREGI